MKPEEALAEACNQWGETAAIYLSGNSENTRYEVGYFQMTPERIFFHILGSGGTLEEAIAEAGRCEAHIIGVAN